MDISRPAPNSPLRISVALCTYNGARYLQEQLDSIATQEKKPDELVLCDDGSTDRTISIAEKFAGEATFSFRIINNPMKLGYSHNFAKAVSLCSGDVIALSDQDDLWYPHKLRILSELFTANPATGGIFSNGDLIDTESNKVGGSLWGSFSFSKSDQDRLRAGQALEVLMQRNVVTGMAFAFRSCWKESFLETPASWPHDAWAALMMAKDDKLLACSERLVAYRIHPDQSIGVPVTWNDKLSYVRANGFRAYLKQSRARNLADYEKYAKQFEDLMAVYAGETQGSNEPLLIQARAKAAHARNAAKLLELHQLRRWPDLIRDRGKYQRYSPTGMKALVRDLFI